MDKTSYSVRGNFMVEGWFQGLPAPTKDESPMRPTPIPMPMPMPMDSGSDDQTLEAVKL